MQNQETLKGSSGRRQQSVRQKGSHISSVQSSMLNSRPSAMYSSRRRTNATTMRSGKSRRDRQRVFLNGVDVTPKSLLKSDSIEKKVKRSGKRSSMAGSSMRISQRLKGELSGSHTDEGSALGSRKISTLSSYSVDSDESTNIESTTLSEAGSQRSDKDNEQGFHDEDDVNSSDEQDMNEFEAQEEQLSTKQLDEIIRVNLIETTTHTLLSLPSLCVWVNDQEKREKVSTENEAYETILSERGVKSNFSQRQAQTFNLPTKNRDVQVQPPSFTHTSSQSSRWDIFDSFHTLSEIAESKKMKKLSKRKKPTKSCEPMAQFNDTKKFNHALDIMEKAVIQNTMHAKHLLYRNSDSNGLRGDDEDAGSLQKLWSFNCDLTAGKNVSSLEWNKFNKDLLASAFGPAEYTGSQDGGLILLWTLKNPYHPIRTFRSRVGVTSLSFCTEHPQLLSAGFYDGTLAIYDVRQAGDAPAVRSSYGTENHRDAVWGVGWMNKSGQQLMSVSTDGHVKQWSLKKGLVPADIMLLKRIPNNASLYAEQPEGMINRHAAGLCFDFAKDDNTHYLVGTEDGIVHQCSTSYNEQVLESYIGHTSTVYRVCCSPFHKDAFLTCSADWTMKLWSQRSTKPVLSFQNGRDYVTDIAWSPIHPCVFSAVSRDGRLEIWDLESSTINPFIQHTNESTNGSLSTVLFGHNSSTILTGGTDGAINVYRIFGLNNQNVDATQEQKALQLEKAMYADRQENFSTQ